MADAAADLVTAATVLVAVLVWLATRSWHPTVPVLLELLLAAGLLRLAAAETWQAIGVAAAIVAIRVLVRVGFEPGPATGARGDGRRHSRASCHRV